MANKIKALVDSAFIPPAFNIGGRNVKLLLSVSLYIFALGDTFKMCCANNSHGLVGDGSHAPSPKTKRRWEPCAVGLDSHP